MGTPALRLGQIPPLYRGLTAPANFISPLRGCLEGISATVFDREISLPVATQSLKPGASTIQQDCLPQSATKTRRAKTLDSYSRRVSV